jgi:hypothetical protein
MKLIKYILLGCLVQLYSGLNAQTTLLETLEKEQFYIQMAVSIQEQIIQCFDEELHSTFEYSFRINNGSLQTTLRSDSVSGFDININIYTDEVASQIKLNSWTVRFGKLMLAFREDYLDKNLEFKIKLMAIFEQEKERYENNYYLNKLPKQPAIVYENLAYAQLAESIFNDLMAIDMRPYGVRIGPTGIYMDAYKNRFIIKTRWMDNRARGLSKRYVMGNLSVMFEDLPKKATKTFDEQVDIMLFTSGDYAGEIKEKIQQNINNRKQAFLKKN